MARIKKLRKEFFYFEPKDKTLKLWDPYIVFSVVKPKTTITGFHNTKIMLSIGRRFNQKKAEEFFKSNDPAKKHILKNFSKETNMPLDKVIEMAKSGVLKNTLLNIWKKSAKILGIQVIVPTKQTKFEIFEYIKLQDPREVRQLVYGSLIALGLAIKLFVPKEKQEEEFIYYKVSIEKKIERLMKTGYSLDVSI